MSTVALRGTLSYKETENSKDKPNDSGVASASEQQQKLQQKQPSISDQRWEWKGMWAFGPSLAMAPLGSQQAFSYHFQEAVDPATIIVPSSRNKNHKSNNEEKEEEVKVTTTKKIGVANNISANTQLMNNVPSISSSEITGNVDSRQLHESTNSNDHDIISKTSATTTTSTSENKTSNMTSRSPPSSECTNDVSKAAPMTTTAANEKLNEEGKDANGSTITTSQILPTEMTFAALLTRQSQPQTQSQNERSSKGEAFSSSSVSESTTKDQFGTLLVEPRIRYPNRNCPPSGKWKGHFENAIRPTRVERVPEEFYLFFQANTTTRNTKGISNSSTDIDKTTSANLPPITKYVFPIDNTDIGKEDEGLASTDMPAALPPPTVNHDTLVLVRGMGTNAFGTFELIGYYDVTAGVIEIQRQYVLLPVNTKQNKRKSRQRRRSLSTTPVSSTPEQSASKKRARSASLSNSPKSYSTRKRLPSWKRKDSQEGEKVTSIATDGSISNSSRKRTKNVVVHGEQADSDAARGTQAGPGATTNLSGKKAVDGGISSVSIEISDSSIALLGSQSTGQTANPSVEKGAAALSPSSASQTTPGNNKRNKTPRKRSGSTVGGKGRSSNTTDASSNTNKSSGAGSTQNIKLPPVGEPKKARWRAAHFLYYQRHDPNSTNQNGNGSGNGSRANGGSGNTDEDRSIKTPKYVVYEGELVNSMREGRGICLYSNALLYEGQWKRNKEHGRGKLWSADRKRLIYDGEWERGRMQGHGTYYYGNLNQKNILDDQKKVEEKLGCEVDGALRVPPGGSQYTGEFKENMRNGLGRYILPDGSVYDGMWNQGKMNGRGVFTWPDYSVYDGEWKDGYRHGQGLLKSSDGFMYDGMWVHNAMEGRGIAKYPNGQTYEGLFLNGRREGRGTMQFTNGAVYEGRFRDDAIDGQGTMKISRSLTVPRERNNEVGAGSNNDLAMQKSKKSDFMVPISFQSDMTHIHAKAGFTSVGD